MPKKVTIEGDDLDSLVSKLAYGEQPTSQPKGPTMRKVTIGGKEFLVDDAMADALEANAALQEEQFNALRGEVENVRRSVAPPPTPVEPPAADDLDTLLFTSPTAALRKVADQTKQELRSEYAMQEAQKAWWAEFYGKHKHLQKSHTIVDAVMRAHFKELERLPENQQMDALAKKVEDELAPYVVQQRQRQQPNDDGDTGRVEPGGRPSVMRGGPVPDDGQPSTVARRTLGDINNAARQRRLEARMGRQQSA